MDQKTFKRELKHRITLGLNYGLQSIEEVLSEDSILMNEFVSFKSQYNDLNRMASQNILPYAAIEQGFNKIRIGLIDIIDRMEEGDTLLKEELPELRNNELQFRKNNFFELLDLHYSNLSNITLTLEYSFSDQKETQTFKGIDAIIKIYKEFFEYGFNDQASFGAKTPLEIEAFSYEFFDSSFARMTPYLKTVRFILDYILAEKMEQSFFLGIFKSVISTYELLFIFYFAISGMEPGFGKLLLQAGFFDERFIQKLLAKEHFDLLKK